MALANTSICDFGWKARDFKLKGVDGKSYTLADARGHKGTLVVFICNHCPYVKASIDRIVAEAKAMREIGIGTITIMPNDTATYREDSFDNMKAFATKQRPIVLLFWTVFISTARILSILRATIWLLFFAQSPNSRRVINLLPTCIL